MPQREHYAAQLEPLLNQAAGYARSFLRHRHQAEDAVQQAALRGLEHFDTFDATRPFKGWWFAILRNGCLDMLRRARAARHIGLDEYELDDATAADAEDWERLAAAMASLSTDHREILRLRCFAELRYRELAEALAIPQGTVMSRLHLARQRLAALLREEE